MRNLTFTLLLLAVSAVAVNADDACRLTVRVHDEVGPLPGSTVTVIDATDHSEIDTLLTNADGAAVFTVRRGADSLMKVEFLGYFDVGRSLACEGEASDINVTLVDVTAFWKDTDPSPSRLAEYEKFLQAMKEPFLWEFGAESSVTRMYRLVYLRSFHRPVTVRLEILEDGSGRVVGKIASGLGGYKPGKLKRTKTTLVSGQEVDAFLSIVNADGFWSIGPLKTLGLDGATWILQGADHGMLYTRERWSPKAGAFRKAAELLLEYSGLEIDPVY
jgi:hypothetical protein